MSTRVLLIATPVLLIGLCGLRLPTPTERVTKADYDRIPLGMTAAEVEAILGRPKNGFWPKGEDWLTKGTISLGTGPLASEPAPRSWGSEHGAMTLWFTHDYRVRYLVFYRGVPQESVWVRLSLGIRESMAPVSLLLRVNK